MSLDQTGFGRCNDEKPFWEEMFTRFEDNLIEGCFSQYVVDQNATLFANAEHPW